MTDDAKQCPWCGRWCLKDDACNYIFACGLIAEGKFVVGAGCGSSWCWKCGKKFCSQYIDPKTGIPLSNGRTSHDSNCCKQESGFQQKDYCPGGHNSHCESRW
jgi:hypothetical protein